MTIAVKPAVSVQYLLSAFKQLKSHQNGTYIVPVSVTYDRIFELCAQESLDMPVDSCIRQLFANIRATQSDKLGDITVKYLSPVNIQEFLQKGNFKEQSAAALALTRHLYQAEAIAQPLTLNSILSSLALYSQNKEPSVKDLAEDADLIY